MPTPTLEYGVRQHTVTPGGRCWIWWPKGLSSYGTFTPVDPTSLMRTGWRWTFPADYIGTADFSWQWAWEMYVSPNETPGVYTYSSGLDGYNLTVTVVAAPSARPKRYVRTSNWSVLQGWLNAGYDLVLEDSTYFATSQLSVPANAQIWGYGATIVASANGQTSNAVFKPLGNFGLYGVTLTHDETIDENFFEYNYIRYIRNFPVPSGAELTISDVTVLRGGLIDHWATGTGGNIIERCTFKGGILGSCPENTLMQNCKWFGRSRNFNVHIFWNKFGPKCMYANLYFSDTARGMTFTPIDPNPIYGCMGLGITFDNVRGGPQVQSEVLNIEGTRPDLPAPTGEQFHDNTFMGVRILNCAGPGIMFYGDNYHDNIMWDFDIQTEIEGIHIAGLHESLGHGTNTFRDIQTYGGGLTLFGKHGAQTFYNVQFVEGQPGRGNKGPYQGWYNRQKRLWPVEVDHNGWTVTETQTWTQCSGIPLNGGEFQVTTQTPNYVSTTDATVTTISTIPLYEDREYTIEATVKGEGVSNRGMLKNIIMAHRATAGSATLDNTTAITVDDAVPGSWAFTAAASGNNILLKVTGEVANTIEWKVIELKIKELEA